MIEGLDDLLKAFAKLTEVTSGDDLADAAEPGAQILLDGMQQRVAVDTGELHDSLRIEVTTHGDSAEVFLETDSDHAEANEFGTHHMPAQPFIRPTFDEDGDKAIDAIADALGKKIERVGR